MERLTEKRDGQNVIPLRQNGKIKWAICSAGLGDAPTKYLYGDHADRLAAYEDTGLEPEEIVKIREDVESGYMKSTARRYGVPVDRLRELAQADREGRVRIIAGPKPREAVCGNCVNFTRKPGTRTGVCRVQSFYRDKHGKEEPRRGMFSPSQSRKACKKFVRAVEEEKR